MLCGRRSKAITAFDFAVICDDAFIGAYLELGKALEHLGRYNEAINHYEITLSIDDPTRPNNADELVIFTCPEQERDFNHIIWRKQHVRQVLTSFSQHNIRYAQEQEQCH